MTSSRRKAIKLSTNIFVYLFVGFLTIGMLYPFAWMLSSSVKYSWEVFSAPMRWVPKTFVFKNYPEVFKQLPFWTYIYNTFKLSVIITFIQIITSSFAAYGFAKLKFPGRNLLFLMYICTISIPWQTYMIPQYIMVTKIGMINTHSAIIILRIFSAFGVFMMRQFYISIPNELCEAARIDGMSEYGIYIKIMLPLSKPALATLIIFTFVGVWNDYFGPLIFLNSNSKMNIQIGLRQLVSQYSAEYGVQMAGAVMALIPIFILFVFLQRYFVEGIATTGVKG
jgi:multiple sugar transport system permease protein